MKTGVFSGFVLSVILMLSPAIQAQELQGVCGSLDNAYGPYDYRTEKKKLVIVERFHFTSSVESLSRGHSGTIAGDLDYTLRASPNHHRALMALIKYGLKQKASTFPGANYSVECYLNRAEEFRPDDAMVKVIYGLYHLYHKRNNEAVAKLEEGRKLDSRNANINYNLGLAYFELKRYDQALEMAHSAYALGFPLPGLKNKLKSVGKWHDPVSQQPVGEKPVVPSSHSEAIDQAQPSLPVEDQPSADPQE